MVDDFDPTDPESREAHGLEAEPQDGPAELDEFMLPPSDFESFEDPDAVVKVDSNG